VVLLLHQRFQVDGIYIVVRSHIFEEIMEMNSRKSVCGNIVKNRRGLLAFTFSLVTLVTLISFITALIYTIVSAERERQNDDDYEEEEEEENRVTSVTSRAETFAVLWTAILAMGISIYGTTVLGLQSPTGKYYNCCSSAVFRTSPLSLGVFIGALLMFANLTMVCSILFGEFQIRDYQNGEGDRDRDRAENSVERSSLAFSIMCLFLTILYAIFAVLLWIYHEDILAEIEADAREEALQPSPPGDLHPGVGGYVGGRAFIDVKQQKPINGFITTQSTSNDVGIS